MASSRLIAVCALVLGLAGCAGMDPATENRASVLENGVFGDIRAKSPRGRGSEPQGLIPVDTSPGRGQIFGPGGEAGGTAAYSADGTDVTGGVDVEGGTEPGAYRLNFENAEIKDVVHAVLGEALKVNYTLTPDVAGTITISSARPVGRQQLLAILETTLAAQGFSMVKSGEVYKIGAMVTGAGVVDRGAATQPGFGVSIVPLRYVSVKTMNRLLSGFVVDAEGIRIDSTSNTILVSGPGSKREEVVRTVLSFDEDWMQDQTVGIFELRRANPAAVVPELERIFDSAGSGSGVVTFKPISRLRSVMVVSRNPALVQRAQSWVQRLDQDDPSSGGTQVFVYRAKHRDAAELAKIASALFAGGSLNFGNTGANGPQDSPSGSDGFQIGTDDALLGGQDPNNPTGEEPIDDVTGAGEGGFGDDGTGGDGSLSASAPPDVLDLTTQGSQSQGSVKISADPSNNTVIIYGDPNSYQRVLRALAQLDVAPVQVAISVTIAEVRLNDELKYGVQYFVKSGGVDLGDDEGSIGFKDVAGALREQVPGFNFLLGSNKNPDLIVSALDRITDVEILSSPSLMVLENQKASLQVGDQIPIAVRQRQSSADVDADTFINEIEYRDTGIILNVTPRVSETGVVTMTVEQEISAVASSGENPTISKRRVASNIAVNDGQTVVLAGLISTQKDNRRNGLPILNRIAGVGDATGNTNKSARRNELIVLIRPQIVRNGEDAESVAEDLRTKLWAIGERERPSP